MTWWAWTLLWVVLVALAGLVLYVAVRRLFRQGMALAREIGDAADMLAEVTRALEATSDPAAPADAGGIHTAQHSEAGGKPRRRPSSTRGSSSRRRRGAPSQDVR